MLDLTRFIKRAEAPQQHPDGPLDVLDHSSPMPKWGTKVGIDATKSWPEEGHSREWPDEIVMSDDIKKMVDEKWKDLGLE